MGHQRVAYIDHGSDVRSIDRPCQEQGPSNRADVAMGTGLLGLVLKYQVHLGDVFSTLDGGLNKPALSGEKIPLERVVASVLPEP